MEAPRPEPLVAAATDIKGQSNASSYDRRGKIGKGAFGDVFLAYPKNGGQSSAPMVLKCIKLARQTQWQREATRREIQLMSFLKFPFIVPMYDHWLEQNHTVNVVLGYCKQGDLSVVLKKRKGKLFQESELKDLFAQMLLAVWYLELQGVLHRDIKTSNIFLHADGHIQLGDFGLASVRDVNDDQSEHDQSLVGTPHFMSPELLGMKGYDHKTDVWSLGCVMYELSSLKSAFNAFDLAGLIDKIQNRGTAPLPKQYTEDYCKMIKSMLIKNPEKRPTVLQLMSEPCMRDAVAKACRLAQTQMPGVELPPLAFAGIPYSVVPATENDVHMEAAMSIDSNNTPPASVESSFACGLFNNEVHHAAVQTGVDLTDKDSIELTVVVDKVLTAPKQDCITQAVVGKPASQPQQPGNPARGNANRGAGPVSKPTMATKKRQAHDASSHASKAVKDKPMPNREHVVPVAGKTAPSATASEANGSGSNCSEHRSVHVSGSQAGVGKKSAPSAASLRPAAPKSNVSENHNNATVKRTAECKVNAGGMTVKPPAVNGIKPGQPKKDTLTTKKALPATNGKPASARDRALAYAAAHASFVKGQVRESAAEQPQQREKKGGESVNRPPAPLGPSQDVMQPRKAHPTAHKPPSGKPSGTRRVDARSAAPARVPKPPTQRCQTVEEVPPHTQTTSKSFKHIRTASAHDQGTSTKTAAQQAMPIGSSASVIRKAALSPVVTDLVDAGAMVDASDSDRLAAVKQSITRLRQLRQAISNPAANRRATLIAKLPAAAAAGKLLIGTAASTMTGDVISKRNTTAYSEQAADVPSCQDVVGKIPSGPSSLSAGMRHSSVTLPEGVASNNVPGQCTIPSIPAYHSNSSGQPLLQQNSYRSAGSNEYARVSSGSHVSDPQLGFVSDPEPTYFHEEPSFDRVMSCSTVKAGSGQGSPNNMRNCLPSHSQSTVLAGVAVVAASTTELNDVGQHSTYHP